MIPAGLEGVRVALTLTAPWASIVIDGPKSIENRSWAPPAWVVGQRIAIHASKTYSEEDWLRARSILIKAGVDTIAAMETWKNWKARAAIIGTARVTGFIDDADATRTIDHRNPWFFGRFGWLLADRRSLAEPLPCRGHQKLWGVKKVLEAL